MIKIPEFPFLEEFINEDVDIPAQFSTRYVAVKKQLADKQDQKNLLQRQIQQKDNEINILQKNLLAIETQAAQIQGKTLQDTQQEEAKKVQGATPKSGQANVNTNESFVEPEEGPKYPEDTEEDFGLGDLRYSTGEIKRDDDEFPILNSEESEEELCSQCGQDYVYQDDLCLDCFNEREDEMEYDEKYGKDIDESVDNEDMDDINILQPREIKDDNEETGQEKMSPDSVFAVKINDPDEDEEIIAKIYRNEDDDFWKIRVVQGSEDPLEAMQFDPEMEMVDIIERLAEIYEEVEEVNIEDYADLIDDKEEIDQEFYNKEEIDKVPEELK